MDPFDVKPQSYEWLDTADVGPFLDDPSWVMEQKLDGVRCLVRWTNKGGPQFLARSGGILAHAASALHFEALTKALAPLASLTDRDVALLDCELIPDTGTLWVFDLPWLGPVDGARISPETPFSERREWLEALFGTACFPEAVRLVPQARTPAEKAVLLRVVEAEGIEGVVVKDVAAAYCSGRRTKRVLKVKFYREADCIVTARNTGGAENATLAVHGDDGELIEVGGCSMIGKPPAQVGAVVEVKYLYVGKGGRLYQPSMLRIRDDKTAEECGTGQLVSVNREVLGG